MNPKFNSDSSAWESVRDTSLTEGHDTAALRDMSALRRVLHLVWEIACRYEIVWNSKQQSTQRAESFYMEKTGKERTTSLIREHVQGQKRRSSQHVELVIARIFSKQRDYAKQRSARSLDLEDVAAHRPQVRV